MHIISIATICLDHYLHCRLSRFVNFGKAMSLVLALFSEVYTLLRDLNQGFFLSLMQYSFQFPQFCIIMAVVAFKFQLFLIEVFKLFVPIFFSKDYSTCPQVYRIKTNCISVVFFVILKTFQLLVNLFSLCTTYNSQFPEICTL